MNQKENKDLVAFIDDIESFTKQLCKNLSRKELAIFTEFIIIKTKYQYDGVNNDDWVPKDTDYYYIFNYLKINFLNKYPKFKLNDYFNFNGGYDNNNNNCYIYYCNYMSYSIDACKDEREFS